MACVFARLLSFDPGRLVPGGPSPGSAPRPKDCHLDSSELEALNIGRRTPFASAIPAILTPHRHR